MLLSLEFSPSQQNKGCGYPEKFHRHRLQRWLYSICALPSDRQILPVEETHVTGVPNQGHKEKLSRAGQCWLHPGPRSQMSGLATYISKTSQRDSEMHPWVRTTLSKCYSFCSSITPSKPIPSDNKRMKPSKGTGRGSGEFLLPLPYFIWADFENGSNYPNNWSKSQPPEISSCLYVTPGLCLRLKCSLSLLHTANSYMFCKIQTNCLHSVFPDLVLLCSLISH